MAARPEGSFIRLTLLLAVMMAASLWGCATSGGADETGRPGHRAGKKNHVKVGTAMPSIVVKEINGKRKLDLGDLHGKVTLVDIWASWCAPCLEEMPLLDDMAIRLRKKQIQIIAISVDEDRESAEAFLGKRPSWTMTVAHDPKGKVPEVLEPSKMPTSYIVDGAGIIRYVNEGFERGDVKALEARLVALAAD